MNLKLASLLATSALTLSLSAQHYQTASENNQALEDTLRNLCQPVKITTSGFAFFLDKVYNQPEYCEVLSNNCDHIRQFLDHGKSTQQPLGFPQSVLRLFGNKMKSCNYINAYAFNAFLQDLPNLLECYFLVQRKPDFNVLQDKINKLVYSRFVEQFAQKPYENGNAETFATSISKELSEEILEMLSTDNEMGDISQEELRKALLIFLEVGLSKLIWSPEDQLDTWSTVKSISEHLAALMDCNILIDLNDLNCLFVTLNERYCFFLDIAGADLSTQFYDEIKADLNSTSLLMLELEEQEEYIEPKIARLRRALEQAQIKAEHKRS